MPKVIFDMGNEKLNELMELKNICENLKFELDLRSEVMKRNQELIIEINLLRKENTAIRMDNDALKYGVLVLQNGGVRS